MPPAQGHPLAGRPNTRLPLRPAACAPASASLQELPTHTTSFTPVLELWARDGATPGFPLLAAPTPAPSRQAGSHPAARTQAKHFLRFYTGTSFRARLHWLAGRQRRYNSGSPTGRCSFLKVATSRLHSRAKPDTLPPGISPCQALALSSQAPSWPSQAHGCAPLRLIAEVYISGVEWHILLVRCEQHSMAERTCSTNRTRL